MSTYEPGPYAYPTPPQQPPPPQRTDGFAIAALVLGIIGWVLVAVPLAVVALVRIRTSGAKGKGLAIAGLVLSGLWTLLAVAGAILFALYADDIRTAVDEATEPTRVEQTMTEVSPGTGDGGTDAGGTTIAVTDLAVGDCVVSWPDENTYVTVVVGDCAGEHVAEVYEQYPLTAAAFPGDEVITTEADTRCEGALGPLADLVGTTLDWTYLYPSDETWADGDRTVICMVEPLGAPFVGPVSPRT